MKTCLCCGREALEYVEFPCPNCGNKKIIRCKDCRKNENEYVCKECGFRGP